MNPLLTLSHYFGFRYTNKASKQLMYLHARKFLKSSAGNVGLDVGCDVMKNYPMFRTDEYLGLDISRKSLVQGIQLFNGAYGIAGDMRNPGVGGVEVVNCLQVIRINEGWRVSYDDDVITAVRDLISLVNCDGQLIFNVGRVSENEVREIRSILNDEFDRVTEVQIPKLPYYSVRNIRYQVILNLFLIFLYKLIKTDSIQYHLFSAER